MSTIVMKLFENYQSEQIKMAYTVEDYKKDIAREHLHWLTPDERLQGLSPDELLQRISPDDIASHLSRSDLEKLIHQLEEKMKQKK